MPEARRTGSAGAAASSPRPRYFQSASVRTAGASPAAKTSSAPRRSNRKRAAGATRKIELDGLIAIDQPAASPAAAAGCQPGDSSARTQRYAETSNATVAG